MSYGWMRIIGSMNGRNGEERKKRMKHNLNELKKDLQKMPNPQEITKWLNDCDVSGYFMRLEEWHTNLMGRVESWEKRIRRYEKKLLKWKPSSDRGWGVREELLIHLGALLGEDSQEVYMRANAEISQVKEFGRREVQKKNEC